MIKPTNGRVVWYTPSIHDREMPQIDKSQPLAAHVAHVYSDRMVNLMVIDSYGAAHARYSVPLIQDDDLKSEAGFYCEWMPYQKGQAAKTEATEALLGKAHS